MVAKLKGLGSRFVFFCDLSFLSPKNFLLRLFDIKRLTFRPEKKKNHRIKKKLTFWCFGTFPEGL